jgi:polar amino acid transport system substrate-binding protein
MKQVVQNFRSGDLAVSEVPAPSLHPGGVLVSVKASLVSAGTERLMVNLAQASLVGKARQRPDQVRQVIQKVQQEGLLTTYNKVMNRLDNLSPLGYSCAGTVIAVGEGVTDLQVGDAVACAGAGYANHAEIVFVPENLVAKIPPKRIETYQPPTTTHSPLFEQAAFTTLGAIALQGIRQAEPRLGETVAVIGLGLLGLLTVQMLKANGCRVLGMDLKPERCQLAGELGCDATATGNAKCSDLTAQWTDGHGADAVLITAGTKSNAPIELAADLCRDRGRVVAVGLVGLDVPRKPFYDKELDLRLSRSYGPGRYDPAYEEGGHDYPIGYVRWTENRNMKAFLDLLAQGVVDVQRMITHRFPIEEATEAYDLITGDQADEALGVILTYPQPKTVDESETVWLRKQPTAKSTSSPVPRPPSSVRLGLIGAGLFAQGTLLPALQGVEKTALRAVCSASGLSARHAAEKHGAVYCASDAKEIFADEEINAVLIATRHNTHAELVIQALQAGKHVFVEKPLAISPTQLDEVGKTFNVQPSNVLTVGYNRRFAPLARRMKTFLDEINDPLVLNYQVNAGQIPLDHWVQDPEIGGGRIIGEVCHFVDFLSYLTDSLPVSVYARALPNDGRYQNDNVAVNLKFEDGSVGTITYVANGDKAYPKERVQAFGGGAVAVLDDFRRVRLIKGGKTEGHRTWFKQDKGHQAELVAFVDAVREGTGAPIPFESLAATTLATFKIEESLRTGEPVAIDLSLRTK